MLQSLSSKGACWQSRCRSVCAGRESGLQLRGWKNMSSFNWQVPPQRCGGTCGGSARGRWCAGFLSNDANCIPARKHYDGGFEIIRALKGGSAASVPL